MTELVAILVVGLLLLWLFVYTLLRIPKEERVPTQAMEKLFEMVPLQGLCFPQPHLLLKDQDFRWLRSNHALRGVAKRHRRDRRKIALHWLRLLQSDLLALWKVRRLFGRFGAAISFGEEFVVSLKVFSLLVLILVLRVVVWMTGPSLAHALLTACANQTSAFLRSCGDLLASIPPSRWAEVQRACSLQSAQGSPV